MSGLQRDHTVNADWTNHEGYNDGTAGAAINNIMREQRRQAPPPQRAAQNAIGGTRMVQVPHKGEIPKPKTPPAQPKQKSPDELLLKTARTLFTICTMICRLQGFTIEDITLRDGQSQSTWRKADLEAPPPKKS